MLFPENTIISCLSWKIFEIWFIFFNSDLLMLKGNIKTLLFKTKRCNNEISERIQIIFFFFWLLLSSHIHFEGLVILFSKALEYMISLCFLYYCLTFDNDYWQSFVVAILALVVATFSTGIDSECFQVS